MTLILTHPLARQYYADHPRRPQVNFGKFLLLQTLGEGEFGKVKLGLNTENGMPAAVKLIRRGSVLDPAKTEKVKREVDVLQVVRHPNIVRLQDTIETDKFIGIILDFAEGGELFDHILANKYLREDKAAKLFAQVVSGVWYLHQKLIVHRDLKLENLLLDANRNIVITDFGFANAYGKSASDLMRTSCGSPCYAAPELVVSEGAYVGTAADIWSCGVILYAMLSGYLPWDDDPANPEGDNINLLYGYITNTALTFPDHVSDSARQLLGLMLQPDPNLRCSLGDVQEHPWMEKYRGTFEFSVEQLEQAADDQFERRKRAFANEQKTREEQYLQQQRLQAERDAALEAKPAMEESVPKIKDAMAIPLQRSNTAGPALKTLADPSLAIPSQARRQSGTSTAVSMINAVATVNPTALPGSMSVGAIPILASAAVSQPSAAPPVSVAPVAISPEEKRNSHRHTIQLEYDDIRQGDGTLAILVDGPATPPAEPILQQSTQTKPALPPVAFPQTGTGRKSRPLSFMPISSAGANVDAKSRHTKTLSGNFAASFSKFIRATHPAIASPNSNNAEEHVSPAEDHIMSESQPVTITQPLPADDQTVTSNVSRSKSRRQKALSLVLDPLGLGQAHKDRQKASATLRQPHQGTIGSATEVAQDKSTAQQSGLTQRSTSHASPTPSGPTSAAKFVANFFRRKTLKTSPFNTSSGAKQAGEQSPQSQAAVNTSTPDPPSVLQDDNVSDISQIVAATVPITVNGKSSQGESDGLVIFDQRIKKAEEAASAFSDANMKLHFGPLHPNSLTATHPQVVIEQVHKACFMMGMDVIRESEFRLKCCRPKKSVARRSGPLSGLGITSSLFPHSNSFKDFNATPENSEAHGLTVTSKDRRMSFLGRSNLFRRSSSNSPSMALLSPDPSIMSAAVSPELGSLYEAARPDVLYGPANKDSGDEVRFTVELTKIKHLPNLYSVDVRKTTSSKQHSSLLAYKYLYESLLDRCLGNQVAA